MVEAKASTAREVQQNRLYNTKLSYLAKQADYKTWCDNSFADLPTESRYTVYGDKLHLYLRERVS
jgi:hypothetical protein